MGVHCLQLPHQLYAKGPGVQKGAEIARLVQERREGPQLRGQLQSVWALGPLSVGCRVFYMETAAIFQ